MHRTPRCSVCRIRRCSRSSRMRCSECLLKYHETARAKRDARAGRRYRREVGPDPRGAYVSGRRRDPEARAALAMICAGWL